MNYDLNTFDRPVEDPLFKEPPLKNMGDADLSYRRQGNGTYTPVGNLYRVLLAEKKER